MNNEKKVAKPTMMTEVVANAALVDRTYLDNESVAAIKDKALMAAVKAYKVAEGKEFNSQWERISQLEKMAAHIGKDFASESELARYMCMSQSGMNKALKIAKVAEECKNVGLSVTNAYELLSLGSVDNIKKAITGHGIADATQKQLRKAVKEVNAKKLGAESVSEQVEIVKATEKKKKEKNEKKEYEEKLTNGVDEEAFPYIVPYCKDNILEDREIILTESEAKKLGEVIAGVLKKLIEERLTE